MEYTLSPAELSWEAGRLVSDLVPLVEPGSGLTNTGLGVLEGPFAVTELAGAAVFVASGLTAVPAVTVVVNAPTGTLIAGGPNKTSGEVHDASNGNLFLKLASDSSHSENELLLKWPIFTEPCMFPSQSPASPVVNAS